MLNSTPPELQSTDPNDTQVGGSHYKSEFQHWDFVWVNDLDYFQGQITKYVIRWRKKGGLQDLKKANHFLVKYMDLIEKQLEDEAANPQGRGYVNQD